MLFIRYSNSPSPALKTKGCGNALRKDEQRLAFAVDGSQDAALGNLLRDPNRLLGSGFCRSRCWLGYHNRIGNCLRNIDGFRAGLMSTKSRATSLIEQLGLPD